MAGGSAYSETPERLLQGVEWRVIRRLDGLLQGNYRSLFYGYGVDFADLREYQPEDDIRYIDWSVTARMNAPYVRQYVEDRDIIAWFLVDLSPSMDFGITGNLKRNVLIRFVATLMRLLTRYGNRVGAILYDNQVKRIIPARGGRIQVLRIIHELLHYSQNGHSGATDLSPLLGSSMYAIKRRSLVFVVSDFISNPGWEKPLTLLNHRHEVLAIRMTDPHELKLPDLGHMVLEDTETGEQVRVNTHDRAFRRRFDELVHQREMELDEAFKRAGVDVLAISTKEDLVRAILRFAKLRQRRRA
jgi:uncharacterized protein (DUF58 family)